MKRWLTSKDAENRSAREMRFLMLSGGAPMTGDGTVLLVDDDPIVRQAVRCRLEREGFRAATAANGTEALRYLNFHSPPSLILLDMMIPRPDGWQVMSMIRQQKDWSHVPVIVTTAIGVASQEWAESLGAVDLLKKPFDDDELMRQVRSHCNPMDRAEPIAEIQQIATRAKENRMVAGDVRLAIERAYANNQKLWARSALLRDELDALLREQSTLIRIQRNTLF